MFDLTGMTALVTGASGGIGSAIAQALAGQGARLAVSGSNADKLEGFRATLSGDHVALPCDLSDGAAVDGVPGDFCGADEPVTLALVSGGALGADRNVIDGDLIAVGLAGAAADLIDAPGVACVSRRKVPMTSANRPA